jgi:hypothetical protein
VEFDLGQSCQISRYVLRHAGASGLDPAHNTRGFTLHVSGDGESWTTLDECRGNTENVTDVEFKPVAARHVKIIVDDPGTDATARIADVEIFGRCDPAQE